MLMCLFLSPKFIAFLRRREFGQNIREEGPQGHQTKAGTPTMDGLEGAAERPGPSMNSQNQGS